MYNFVIDLSTLHAQELIEGKFKDGERICEPQASSGPVGLPKRERPKRHFIKDLMKRYFAEIIKANDEEEKRNKEEEMGEESEEDKEEESSDSESESSTCYDSGSESDSSTTDLDDLDNLRKEDEDKLEVTVLAQSPDAISISNSDSE